jgi:hypothetical protein
VNETYVNICSSNVHVLAIHSSTHMSAQCIHCAAKCMYVFRVLLCAAFAFLLRLAVITHAISFSFETSVKFHVEQTRYAVKLAICMYANLLGHRVSRRSRNET